MINFKRILAKTICFWIERMERKECPGAAVFDVPDIRDHVAPEIDPPVAKLPENFCLADKVAEFKFEPEKQSKNSCTAYSKKYSVEVMNTIWNQKLCEICGEKLWAKQELTGAKRDGGDTLQNSQKQFHKFPQGFPQSEYLRLRWTGDKLIEQMKLWIYARFCPIQTGGKWRYSTTFKRSNFSHAKETGEYEPWIGGKVVGAHAFVVWGWVGDYWIVLESELEQYGDNPRGQFLVHMKHTEALFSKYVARDLKDDVLVDSRLNLD